MTQACEICLLSPCNCSSVSFAIKQQSDNCLIRADQLINGPRRSAYGPVEDSFIYIAAAWSALLRYPVTPKQVAQCMIALKQCREANCHSQDNLDDIAGYTALAEKVKDIPAPLEHIFKKQNSSYDKI